MKITVGTSGTGGGFEKFCAGETDISTPRGRSRRTRRPRSARRTAINYEEVQVANDGIAVVTNTELKVDCLTTDQLKQDLEQGLEGHAASAESTRSCPTPSCSSSAPARTPARSTSSPTQINGEEGVSRNGLPALRGRQRARPGRRGRAGRPRLLRLLLLRAEPGQAEPRRVDGGTAASSRPRRRSRAASTSRCAPAVHVPEREVAQAARGEGVHGLRARELRGDLEAGRSCR